MAMISAEEMEKVYQKVVTKAITDADFRKELLANPNQAIEKETGIPVPAEYRIRIIEEDPAYLGTFFLPAYTGEELSDDDMMAVAGGAACGNKGNCFGNAKFEPCGGRVCGANK